MMRIKLKNILRKLINHVINQSNMCQKIIKTIGKSIMMIFSLVLGKWNAE